MLKRKPSTVAAGSVKTLWYFLRLVKVNLHR